MGASPGAAEVPHCPPSCGAAGVGTRCEITTGCCDTQTIYSEERGAFSGVLCSENHTHTWKTCSSHLGWIHFAAFCEWNPRTSHIFCIFAATELWTATARKLLWQSVWPEIGLSIIPNLSKYHCTCKNSKIFIDHLPAHLSCQCFSSQMQGFWLCSPQETMQSKREELSQKLVKYRLQQLHTAMLSRVWGLCLDFPRLQVYSPPGVRLFRLKLCFGGSWPRKEKKQNKPKQKCCCQPCQPQRAPKPFCSSGQHFLARTPHFLFTPITTCL